jgi:acetyltransferase-like isoleucine patch superfamily enzyme
MIFEVLRFLRRLEKAKRLRAYMDCAAWGKETVLSDDFRIINPYGKSAVTIGPGCFLCGKLLLESAKATIRIGNDVYVGPGSILWGVDSIQIGDRCTISHGVNIHDTNSHSLSAKERHKRFLEKMRLGKHLVPENAKSGPVVIEDDVWIGFNAVILKGVKIGRGAVVGAGSVITKDVEPFTIVVGNPQRVVGQSLP